MATGKGKQGSDGNGLGNGRNGSVDLRGAIYQAFYAPYAHDREQLLGWGFNLVNDFDFPTGYHSRFLAQKFGRELPQVMTLLAQMEPAIVDAAMVLGAVLWLAREYPRTYCKALLSEDERFLQWLREKVRALEERGISVLYLKRVGLYESFSSFTFNDLDFNVERAAQIVSQRPRAQGIVDVKPLYEEFLAMGEPSERYPTGRQVETDEAKAMSAVVSLEYPLLAVTLPSTLGNWLVIDGWHRIHKAYNLGIETLKCDPLTLAETERCLLSELFRPLWQVELDRRVLSALFRP